MIILLQLIAGLVGYSIIVCMKGQQSEVKSSESSGEENIS